MKNILSARFCTQSCEIEDEEGGDAMGLHHRLDALLTVAR